MSDILKIKGKYHKEEKKRLERTQPLTMRLSWTGQSRAAFERQYLTESFYL